MAQVSGGNALLRASVCRCDAFVCDSPQVDQPSDFQSYSEIPAAFFPPGNASKRLLKAASGF